jgi:transposase-like protein
LSKTVISQTSSLDKKEDDDLVQQRFMNPESKYQEESIIDCPDCFDTMIKVYDSEDRTRYYCENCDYLWVE